ncbi:DUF3644 domain-containing protein [Lactococcus petauri]|uniref:DUF3644 domain-containing protein n=2 Tax=Lactococcus petauri TaxID=1940789 RepID=UPI003BF8390D
MELSNKLVEKSIEAFIMGLEIYNKPTIQYRVEGFAFFICNSWELMLKAKMINDFGENSIYYPDKPDRTIDLSRAVKKIFTNNKDPLRLNIEKIISLRNMSTHFITDDYERIYAPLFQACVTNFSNKLLEFHSRDITDEIPQNFLTLSLSLSELTDVDIRAKYTPEIAEKFIIQRNELMVSEQQVRNPKFAISIEQNLYITKNKDEAQFLVAVDRNADAKGTIIKEMRDPSNTHNYGFKTLLDAVNNKIELQKIDFQYKNSSGEIRKIVTTNDLTLFIKFYDMKQDPRYSYLHVIGKSNSYSYSNAALDFIVGAIKKEPHDIIEKLKKAISEKKKE